MKKGDIIMEKITQREFDVAVIFHEKWLKNMKGGERLCLNEKDFRGLIFNDLNLKYAVFKRCIIDVVNVNNVNFNNVEITESSFKFSKISNTTFKDAELVKVDFSYTDLIKVDLNGANMEGVILDNTDIVDTNLRGVSLTENIIQVGPIGSNHEYVTYDVTRDILTHERWKGPLNIFTERIYEMYPSSSESEINNKYRKDYVNLIVYLSLLK